jgi:hypothetical protein
MSGWCLPSLEPDHWVTPNLFTGEPVSQYSNPRSTSSSCRPAPR